MSRIREAIISDFEAISVLENKIFTMHYNARQDMIKPRQAPLDYDYFKKCLTDENMKIFVFDEDGEILGHCFVRRWEHKNHQMFHDMVILEIDDICVDEKAQNKGIGRLLFECVMDYAVEIDAVHLELTVWKFNDKARHFFEHLGMEERICRMEMIIE